VKIEDGRPFLLHRVAKRERESCKKRFLKRERERESKKEKNEREKNRERKREKERARECVCGGVKSEAILSFCIELQNLSFQKREKERIKKTERERARESVGRRESERECVCVFVKV